MASPVPAVSSVQSINPATGEVVARFDATPVEELSGIFRRAREVQAEWAAKPISTRCQLLRKLADVLRARRDKLAGIVTQSLFQNPLASPMSLGLTAGGGLCVLPLFLLGFHLSFPILIPIVAFLCALGTLLLVYTLAQEKGHVQLSTLLLTGMALSTILSAIQGTFFYAFREEWSLMRLLTPDSKPKPSHTE